MADSHDPNHPPFIAHHFDDARQQFDAGKLGIWVFLVTEILFFSGLFCAYVLYRNSNPDIFYQAHFQLDKVLGGANTIVLLFSSLTMAIAVRASQLGQKNVLINNLVITMVCAAVFLGVKAVEYSHKWDEGILTRGYFTFDPDNIHHAEQWLSPYLIILSSVPALLLVGFTAVGVLYRFTGAPKLSLFFFYLAIMMGGYFIGAAAGKLYMDVKASAPDKHGAHAAGAHGSQDHDSAENGGAGHEGDHDHGDEGHGDEEHGDEDHEGEAASTGGMAENSGDEESAVADEAETGPKTAVALPPDKRKTGIFFSIYYCMTGLHAIHVIAGMIALSWLLWRAMQGHFRPDYFGPVDYVGLYWHLVDLIWIYLFPLLYLIK